MKDEVWEKLSINNNFEISNYGRIRNVKKNIIRKLTTADNGYLITSVWDVKNKKRTRVYIHREVANNFCVGSGECVNHIDGNKNNNYYKNLEWCSLAYNTKHAYKNKLIKNYKPIEVVETGQKFKSVADCIKWLKSIGYSKANHSNIILCIQGKRNMAYGHTYKYI